MNKKALVASGAGLGMILLIVVASFLLKEKTSFNKDTQTPTKGMMEETSQTKTLRDFFTLNKNQKCTTPQGTIYISDKKVRGDMPPTHFIVDNDTVYTWMDDQNQGYKMTISKLEEENLEKENKDATSSPNVLDLNQKVNYECSDWAVDTQKFVLPKGISFTDLTSLMQKSTTQNQSSKSDQCSACNSLPQEAKDECLEALNCK